MENRVNAIRIKKDCVRNKPIENKDGFLVCPICAFGACLYSELNPAPEDKLKTMENFNWINENTTAEDVLDMILADTPGEDNRRYAIAAIEIYGKFKQRSFCHVCNLPTDGKNCYYKRCPVEPDKNQQQ